VLRGLLAAGALGVAGSVAAQTLNARYAFAASTPSSALSTTSSPGYSGDVLVVLSLRGGFDGLSAVVPVADPDYLRLRPILGIPAGRLIGADARFGLHPAMAPLLPFWSNGSLAAVHAVGQVDPTRSHFEAMAELERAAPGTGLRTGWLDRTLGVQPGASIFKATQLGSGQVTGALTGPQPELAMDSIDGFELGGAWNATERARWATALTALHRGAPSALAAPTAGALSALATTAGLKEAGYTPGAVAYPDTDTAKALRDIARLIRANVGLKVACLEQGDWDMHADLGTPDSGRFVAAIGELAGALAAFATDLGPAGLANVTIVTLSEFGRRVEENGSGGVDHGHGNAVLLLGGGVAGGTVHGRWPGLSDAALVDGDLAGTTDYRTILAEILTKRCGVASASAVFPGLTTTPLGVVRPRS
jgi:uncharacterized protein (DUF1501 family)